MAENKKKQPNTEKLAKTNEFDRENHNRNSRQGEYIYVIMERLKIVCLRWHLVKETFKTDRENINRKRVEYIKEICSFS